ncbi:hypothetical protein V8B55DRAFT_1573108 [Mucor lusitanicus]|uniref:Uncharacterized protein n=2 Tax=Mucor circinelloides f. lusitanicus TaxID=29924 RepID=A0A168HS60_MUCCL|nr:hypothetical protein FB192DRAFT_1462735 [Mucor lusitanicus]OAC99117.1 hypothetical protein MUCCIDRAFT_84069 [Mucor lusitanicus CBS 277.49]
MLSKKPHPHADLVVMATGHNENLLSNQIDHYRKSIIQLAQNTTYQLAVKGMLIIGTRDSRYQVSGNLGIAAMLVLEGIEQTRYRSRLSEDMMITVTRRYSMEKDAFNAE